MTATLPDYTDLSALFINCTLKRSPEPSNTQGLVDASAHIMREHGLGVDIVRAVRGQHRPPQPAPDHTVGFRR
jgi:hypothetical protein